MLKILIILICGVLWRLDGKGKNDPTFLPFPPLDRMYGWSLNYARYLTIPLIYVITHDLRHLITYAVVISLPYGEKHWWMKYGVFSWFVYGLLLGLASLSWGVALWFGCVVMICKKLDVDHSLFEFFVLGCGSVLWLLWK